MGHAGSVPQVQRAGSVRPRKIILLYADPLTIPLLRMPLECTGHYRVMGEDTIIGTLGAFAVSTPELVIFDGTKERDLSPVSCMKATKPWVPVVVLSTVAQAGRYHAGDRTLFRPSMCELLECVKVMSARKRGPRPGSQRKPVASVAVETREAVVA